MSKHFIHNKLFSFLLILPVILISCSDKDDEIQGLQEQVNNLQAELKQANDSKKLVDAQLIDLQAELQKTKDDKDTQDKLLSQLQTQNEVLLSDIETTVSRGEYDYMVGITELILQMVREVLKAQAYLVVNDYTEELLSTSVKLQEYIYQIFYEALGFERFSELVNELISNLPVIDENVIVLSGNLEGVTELRAGIIYLIDGWVTVPDGATLRIEAGTVIKGKTTTPESVSVLMIDRGGKIEANGTPERPIIFTYEGDPLQVDGRYPNDYDPNLIPRGENLWGGVVILGKSGSMDYAPFNGFNNEDYEIGGGSLDDNSGHLRYVSIRYGGSFVENEFLNRFFEMTGLVLAGVGSGTIIDNVEIVGGIITGILIYHGSVDVTNLVVSEAPEKGIGLQGYSGNLENAVVVLGDQRRIRVRERLTLNIIDQTQKGLYVSGSYDEALTLEESKFQLSNITIIGSDTGSNCGERLFDVAYSHFDGNAVGTLENIAYINLVSSDVAVQIGYPESGDPETSELYDNGNLIFDAIDVVFADGCSPKPLKEVFIDYSEGSQGKLSQDADEFAEVKQGDEVGGAIFSDFAWSYWYQTTQQ